MGEQSKEHQAISALIDRIRSRFPKEHIASANILQTIELGKAGLLGGGRK